MSYWTTRTRNDTKIVEYVVVQHKLRNVNGNVCGIKFRDGYAVVIKDSKAHHMLKKTSALSLRTPEPLLFLKDLKFVTKTRDIETIFGKDVYVKYTTQLNEFLEEQEEYKIQKEQEEQKIQEEQHVEGELCQFRKSTGALCKNLALDVSPSKYCKLHILKDPKLVDFGVEVPKFIPKKEKQKLRESIIKRLSK